MFQKKLKSILFKGFIIFILLFLQAGFFSFAFAEEGKVNYDSEIIIDSDLDGLTDEGEKQIFKTDPSSSDTDKDGFFDGAEILSGTDPLDRVDPVGSGIVKLVEEYFVEKTPWAWYLSRASGFLAYIFLWFSILLGLAIRNSLLQKIIKPIYSLNLHCFTSVSAIFWALFHGVSFLFHEGDYRMNLREAFVPLYFKGEFVDSGYLAFGIIAFYILTVIAMTSFAKKWISHRVWRAAHYLNWSLLPLLGIHIIFLGTEMQNQTIKISFLFSIFILVPLYLANLFFVIKNKLILKTK